MRWKRYEYAARTPRPKVRSMTNDERESILAVMVEEIARSPILTAFKLQVRLQRGRFYLEWQWDPESGGDSKTTYGRVTPLADPSHQLLLEIESRNQWSEVGRGSPATLIKTVADDTKGTFHGLGSLDKSIRAAGLSQSTVRRIGPTEFVFAETEEQCTVQQALFHFFGVPIHVIAQPAGWYSCHRTPRILECSEDRTRVLVRFSSTSWSGETFGGTCLYLNREGKWGAYTIRPNQSDNISSAEAWLVKRKWKPWF